MSWHKLVPQISSGLGLKTSSATKTFFGKVEQFPIQIFSYEKSNQQYINLTVNFLSEANEEIIKDKLISDLSSDKTIIGKNLQIIKGKVVYTYIKSLFDKRKAEDFITQIKKIISALNNYHVKPEVSCIRCTANVNSPILLNAELTTICDSCIQTAQMESERAKQAYDLKSVNYPLVLLVGILACLLGAAIWAAITIGTGKMYSLIAVLNGILVAYAMLFVAGKKTNLVLAGIIIFTIISVILGNLGYFAFQINEDLKATGDYLDLNIFVQNAHLLLLEDVSGTMFAGFCGLLGAIGALSLGEKYSAPKFIVEKLN